MRTFLVLILLALALAGAGYWWARPVTAPDPELAGMSGDAEAGERVFWASGCASCHAAPGATGEDRLVLAGGVRLDTDFGTFVAPNVSPHPMAGIGGWTLEEFDAALRQGVSPDGRHYYPAFPYAAYAKMTTRDVADLWAFWQTLPLSQAESAPHEVGFPFSLHRGVAVWKALYMDRGWVLETPADTQVERGRYLVEALGHCAECHTPRTALGGLDTAQWMAGAPNPSGDGRIPNITPAVLDWSEADIAYYLETGFTPSFDSVGGSMVSVVRNLSNLPAADREAMAAYLKAIPGIE